MLAQEHGPELRETLGAFLEGARRIDSRSTIVRREDARPERETALQLVGRIRKPGVAQELDERLRVVVGDRMPASVGTAGDPTPALG